MSLHLRKSKTTSHLRKSRTPVQGGFNYKEFVETISNKGYVVKES
jgi:hypothetical protein